MMGNANTMVMMRGLMYLVLLCFSMRTAHAAGGMAEVHFLQFSTSCSDTFGGDCEPYFKICFGKPGTPTNTIPSAASCLARAQTSHHHDNHINIEAMPNFLGLRNPWQVHLTRFTNNPKYELVIEVHDANPVWDDHEATFGGSLRATVYRSRAEALAHWKPQTLTGSGQTMKIKYLFYCQENYYTSTCSVYCTPGQNYHCDKDTGKKICNTGWTGDECNQDRNECDLGFCLHGQCTNLQGDYFCDCPEHYSGKNCSVADNACEPINPCKNGGLCVPNQHAYDYYCSCPEGFTGSNCEVWVDPCEERPCKNNGQCTSRPNHTEYSCKCSYPYEGEHCTTFNPTMPPTTTTESTTSTTTTTTTTTTTPTTTTPTTTIPTTRTPTPTIPTRPSPTRPPLTSTTVETGDSAAQGGNQRSTTSTPAPSTSSTSSSTEESSNGQGAQQQQHTGSDDSGFELWYLAFVAAALLLALILLLLVFIRRRRKKSNPPSPSVSFDGQELSFENNLYSETNNRNTQVEQRQARALPVLPTTPTDDDSFNPIKPQYDELDETQGAVGGVDEVKPKKFDKDDEVTPRVTGSARAQNNPYSDFNTLKREAQRQKEEEEAASSGDESPYQELDDVAITPSEINFDSSALAFNMDLPSSDTTPANNGDYDHPPSHRASSESDYLAPTSRPVSNPSTTNTDYDNPITHPNDAGSSMAAPISLPSEYDNPRSSQDASDTVAVPQASAAFNDGDVSEDDGSEDESNDQEDIAQLKKSVRDNQRQNLALENPGFDSS